MLRKVKHVSSGDSKHSIIITRVLKSLKVVMVSKIREGLECEVAE